MGRDYVIAFIVVKTADGFRDETWSGVLQSVPMGDGATEILLYFKEGAVAESDLSLKQYGADSKLKTWLEELG